jgi:hypothetical protein
LGPHDQLFHRKLTLHLSNNDIAVYLGIDEQDLDQCPATIESTQSSIPLIFEYKLIFGKAVPCSICQDIEDGCCLRGPAWLIEGN